MNKYMKYYYASSFIVLVLIILNYYLDLDQVTFYGMYGSGTFFIVPAVFVIIGIISLLYNIACNISKKYTFNEENLLFPKYYLMFFIIIVVLGLIYNQIAFIKGLHFMYYFTFIAIGYAMLSVYTSLSFEKVKTKTKKQQKKNK